MVELMLTGAAAGMGLLWWSIAASKRKHRSSSAAIVPPGAAVASDPLLTDKELSLYNLLQMAAQDHYLIFVRLPLWSFISVKEMGKDRVQLLKRMALTEVDFALMHPGSRRVEQVVQVEDDSPAPQHRDRQRLIELILNAAGIKLVKVRSDALYTIPELTALLGLGGEE